MGLIADLKTASETALSATAEARGIAPEGEIMDISGNLRLCYLKAAEMKVLLQEIDGDIGAANDAAIQTIITNSLAAL